MECTVYMGKEDIQRQKLNVMRMEMLGAKVVSVESGSNTLKDATNEAIRTLSLIHISLIRQQSDQGRFLFGKKEQ